MFETPILFLIFNRPETTRRVFEEIKKQKPKYLFLAADGARAHIADEKEKCEITRNIVLGNIDWDCEVKTLFRDENLGCGVAVSEAISWFFSFVEKGIILEDDTLPNDSFFVFCDKMLEHHKDDSRIMHISGSSYVENIKCKDYYFTKLPFIWGWATWKRAWLKYDYNNKYILPEDKNKILKSVFSNDDIVQYWSNVLKDFHLTHKSFTWDYQWFLSVWINDGLVIQPCLNLVQNIGFGENATHTIDSDHFLGKVEAEEFNLKSFNPKIKLNSKLQNDNFYFYFKSRNRKSLSKKIIALKNKLKFKAKLKIGKLIYNLYHFYNRQNNFSDFDVIKNNSYNSHISNNAKLYPVYKIQNSTIGDYSYVAKNSIINNTSIGKFCSIGPNLVCGWGIHPKNGISTHPMFYSTAKQNGMSLSLIDKIDELLPIHIGNDVFIGMNVTILDGVTIGDGAIIGAGAVVSKNIPAYAIAVGNPIKVINYRFDNNIIDKLHKIKWWDFTIEELNLVEEQFFDVDKFITMLEKRNEK